MERSLHVPEGRGDGITVALVDDGVIRRIPPLRQATIIAKNFAARGPFHDTHGTLCAATMVGRCDAFEGLVPNARLLSARVRGAGPGSDALCKALAWLLDERPHVVLIPMGRAWSCGRTVAGLRRLANAGVALIAAAGNRDPEQCLFPASSRLVTAVTATDLEGRPAGTCYRGPEAERVLGRDVPTWGLHGPTSFGQSSAAATIAAAVRVARLSSDVRRCS